LLHRASGTTVGDSADFGYFLRDGLLLAAVAFLFRREALAACPPAEARSPAARTRLVFGPEFLNLTATAFVADLPLPLPHRGARDLFSPWPSGRARTTATLQ
jgi:hypothetical protein